MFLAAAAALLVGHAAAQAGLIYQPPYQLEPVKIKRTFAYNHPNKFLNQSSCAAVINPQGDETYGDLLKNHPYIGGIPMYVNPDEGLSKAGKPACGTCWQLLVRGPTIRVLIVDQAEDGIVISDAAWDQLTEKSNDMEVEGITAWLDPRDGSC